MLYGGGGGIIQNEWRKESSLSPTAKAQAES